MYIEMKKPVRVPKNLFCVGCSAISKSGDMNPDYKYYCAVTGEFLKYDKRGVCIKTNTCFGEVRKHLINGGD